MKGTLAVITGTVAFVLLASAHGEDALDVKIRNGWKVAAFQEGLVAQPSNKTLYPTVTSTDAAQVWTYSAPGQWNWTCGFFPGSLWLLHQEFAASGWNARASVWQAGIEPQKTSTSTQDLGFIVFTPFGSAYRLTGVDTYRQVIVTAANSLSQRYNAKVGALQSWGSDWNDSNNFRVLIDVMMNLELMFWASKHGGSSVLYDRARQHALTTLKNHIRRDGSSYHLVTFNPGTGAVKSRTTVQGYSDSSTWSRGQAWGLYGFTMTYRYTRETVFRDTARKMADWYIAHLPSNSVPYWDFNDPAIPNAPRDSSAAAVSAAGLFELALLESDATRAARYRLAAKQALSSLLSAPYLASPVASGGYNSQALLLQSTYNHHNNGTQYNQGTAWGDYYLLESMMRYRRVNPGLPALPIAKVTATSAQSGNPAASAVDGNLATRWSTYGDGQSITVDLGRSRLVQKVAVAFHSGDLRSARFDIATSDGTTWTTRFRGMSSGQTTASEYYDFPDVTAPYVRIIGHGTTSNLWNSITELAVY